MIQIERISQGERQSQVILVDVFVHIFHSSAKRNTIRIEIIAHTSPKGDVCVFYTAMVSTDFSTNHPIVFKEITAFEVNAPMKLISVVVTDAHIRKRSIARRSKRERIFFIKIF